MQKKSNYNLFFRILSGVLIILHLVTFGPLKDALAFTAQSASFKLTSGSPTQGGKERSASSAKIWQDTLIEPAAGKTQSANFILTSGFIPTIQSNPPIQAQIIPHQTWGFNESRPDAFDLNDYFSSPDGYALTYTVSGNSKINVSIDPTTHKVSFTQPDGWFGLEKIYFYAADTEGSSIQSNKIVLQVANVSGQPNKPAVIETSISPSIIKEGDLVTLTVRARDPDNQELAFAYSDFFSETRKYKEGDAWVSVATWQTNSHSNGHYTVRVTVTDPASLTDTDYVLVNIGNINHPPVLEVIPDITANEGDLVTISPRATDADADAITYYFAAPFDSQGKWLTSYDAAGTYNIPVIASDGIDTVQQTAKVTINNTNRPPQATLTLTKYTVRPNEVFGITVHASDPDSDAMTFSLRKDGAVIASGNILDFYSVSTSFSSIGDHNISVTVTDSNGLAHTAARGVDVADPNANRNYINPVMGDFNGDALTDLGLHNAQNGTWEVCLSDGGIFRNAVTWLSDFGASLDYWPMGGDFNGDGRTDVATYNITSGQLTIALSGGSSFSNSGTWLTASFATYSWQPFTGNFNADKYTDFALYNKDTGEVKIALGTGTGFGAFSTWASGIGTEYVATSGDFNGDSLGDLCLFKKSSGEVKVAFSDSRAFVDGASWISGFAADKDLLISDFNSDGLADIGFWDKNSNWYYAISKGNGFVNKGAWLGGFGSSTDESATTGDFNGDGVMDAAVFDKDKIGILRWAIRLSTDRPADLLTEIDNGIGGKTQITYTYAALSDNDLLPFPVYVASSISSVNTFPADRAATYTQNFNFFGGYYDAIEREFRGFAKVKVTDPITNNYSETYFYQGKPGQDGALKGQIDKIVAYDGNGRQISYSSNVYEVRKAGPQNNFLGFPALKEQATTVWEENAATLSTKTKFTYDNIGNVTEKIEEGDIAKAGDERSANTAYTPAYQFGFNRPQNIIVKDYDGSTLSKKNFTYDTKGNPIREEAWLYNPLTQTEAWIPADYTYDSFGNVISSTNALGSTVSTEYETAFYTFPEKITNSLGHAITYIYEPKFGAVKSVTDPNGSTSTTTYDSLGRVTEVKNALNQIPTTYSYPDFNTKVTTNALGLAKTEYIDGLGRKYKAVSSGEDGPNPRAVTSETFYNIRGQTEKESLPHYVDDDPTQISYVRYEYDVRGRVKKTISDFPGTASDAEAQVNYINPLYTETIDPQGHKKGTLKDIFGNILEVTEFTQGGVYKTNYLYDSQNNLVKTTDSKGNITQIFYDSLGRKIKMVDPDMGAWTYEYDIVGNLLKQTDAKGQILQFTYDVLNRLTNKSSLRGAAGAEAISTYFYDDTSKANCVGRLSKITDLSGSTEFFYDSLGREIKSIKTVDSNQYVVVREYDILDRLTKLTYPDNSVVDYSYDANSGLLESLRAEGGAISYVQDISYNAKGQIKAIRYGNNTSTTYTYGQDLRLSQILTQNTAQTLQDLNYIFDKNGNITTLTDNLRSNIRAYTYDDLDRLTQAENVPAPGGGFGTYSYKYDSIGNMTERTEPNSPTLIMTYGQGAGPHALTSAGGYTYQYDSNGNMTVGKNKTMEYDPENRLNKVTDFSGVTTFVYDGDGGRVKKVGATSSTAYIGSLYEVASDATITKHIFAGSNRVCSISSLRGAAVGGDEAIYYYHSDHLGSSSIITDQAGQQTNHYEYAPYGTLATSEGTDTVNHKFTGKELDSTGLYFYGARYYDPEIGRFITADPTIQHPYDPQDLNRFSYCRNNPLNLIDPTGLGWWKNFWNKIFKPLISAVAAIVAVWLVPSFTPLIIQYGFWTVAGTAAVSAAGATATLDTGVGRQFIRGFGHYFFDNILGMSPQWANLFASFVSHTLLASAYYIGLSPFTMPANYSGPNYTKLENQQGEIMNYRKDVGDFSPGGNSANNMRLNGGKADFIKEGMIVSKPGFQNMGGAKQALGISQINHSAFLGNVNGTLVDSSSYSLWFGKAGYSGIDGLAIWGTLWTGTCHQSTFNTLMLCGASSFEAFGATLHNVGWSFIGSSTLYGINGAYGLSGITNASVQKR